MSKSEVNSKLDGNCKEFEDLTKKISELEEKILRELADSENLKKRVQKEKEDILKYCMADFAKDILTIRDNLKLAVSNCKEENSPIIEGVKLTMSEMDKILQKQGVNLIEALNKQFDPHLHQAMFEIHSKEVKPGIVLEVVQDGFTLHSRLLRPCLVGVSKE